MFNKIKKGTCIMSHKIVRFVFFLIALISPVALLVGAARLINLPTPFDVICIIVTLTWLIPRLRGIYLRGIIVGSSLMAIVSGNARRVGLGVIAFSDDTYNFSQRVRRFVDRWEREEKGGEI